MTRFFRRFTGALVLDPAAFEDVEADTTAALQSVAVVLLACAAAGFAAIGLGMTGVGGFTAGAVLALGAWFIWIMVVTLVGTITLPEPETHSSVTELLRTMGFAAAPGVFLAFAALRPAAPFVFTLVLVWMIAADVVAMRQALDYRSTGRAVAVSVLGWLLSLSVIGAVSFLLAARVS